MDSDYDEQDLRRRLRRADAASKDTRCTHTPHKGGGAHAKPPQVLLVIRRMRSSSHPLAIHQSIQAGLSQFPQRLYKRGGLYPGQVIRLTHSDRLTFMLTLLYLRGDLELPINTEPSLSLSYQSLDEVSTRCTQFNLANTC